MAERDLSLLADDAFRPPHLLSATIYDASPRLRPDIVMNNLTAVAKTTGTFPDLSMRWTVPEGVDDLSGAWTGHGNQGDNNSLISTSLALLFLTGKSQPQPPPPPLEK